jgi:hypothetical protein
MTTLSENWALHGNPCSDLISAGKESIKGKAIP